MSDDILTSVEKQMEGTNLALAAVAEVLQKMDARFSADEDAVMRKAEEDAANAEHTALVKEIATAVVSVIKADNEGQWGDGTKVNNASGTGKSAGNADDSEKKVSPDSKTESVQATIQAMLKDEAAEDFPDDEEDEEDKAAAMRKEGEAKDEDEEEEDMDYARKAEDDEDEDDDMSEMRKRLDALKKQVAEYEGSMEKMIKVESESRLRKMGIKEERSLVAPRNVAVGLGVDGSTPIAKAQSDADVVDQLSNLSYKQLREMQAQMEFGVTEGLPRELIERS